MVTAANKKRHVSRVCHLTQRSASMVLLIRLFNRSNDPPEGNAPKKLKQDSSDACQSPTQRTLVLGSNQSNTAAVAAEVAEAAKAAGLDGHDNNERHLSDYMDDNEFSQLDLTAMFNTDRDAQPSPPIELLPMENEGPCPQSLLQELDVDVASRATENNSPRDDSINDDTWWPLIKVARQQTVTIVQCTPGNDCDSYQTTNDSTRSQASQSRASSQSMAFDETTTHDQKAPVTHSTPAAKPKHESAQYFPHFQDCPTVVRQQILENIMKTNRTIEPYYNHGSVSVHEEHDLEDDIDLSFLFTGNRQYFEDASAVFYGCNFFRFEDPKIGLWWLRHIGSNLRKVKHATFVLNQGISNHTTDCAGVRLEKQWSILFHWLQPRHELKSVRVYLDTWYKTDFSSSSVVFEAMKECRRTSYAKALLAKRPTLTQSRKFSAQYLDIEMPRDDVFMCLLNLRGLDFALLQKARSRTSLLMCELIEGAMQLEHGETTGEIESLIREYKAVLKKTGKERKRYDMS